MKLYPSLPSQGRDIKNPLLGGVGVGKYCVFFQFSAVLAGSVFNQMGGKNDRSNGFGPQRSSPSGSGPLFDFQWSVSRDDLFYQREDFIFASKLSHFVQFIQPAHKNGRIKLIRLGDKYLFHLCRGSPFFSR